MPRLRFAVLAFAALGLAPLMAVAQDYDDGNAPGDRLTPYDRAHDDDDYARQGDSYDGSGVPYAGRYLGYDYVAGKYYRWDSPEPQDRRAREQDGWRDGVTHTRPAGYGWRRYDLCGCGRYSYYRTYGRWGQRGSTQLDPRRLDYTPSYTYAPRSYYRSWITRRSDFPW